MDTLSSCYFCGTALDEPLQAYPVVPESVRADDDDPTTATLCPACHQKLDTVLDEVLAAVDAGATADSAAESPPGDAQTGDDLSADGSTVKDDDDGSTADDDDDAPTGGDDESVGDADTDDGATQAEDAESERPDGAAETVDGDEVTADAVDALAGDSDSSILDDTVEDETEDDLESAMEPEMPEEFATTGADEATAADANGDSGADEGTDDIAPDDAAADDADESESSTDGDEVTADDVDALAGDIDSSILDDEDDAVEDETEGDLEAAMEPDVPDEFATTGADDDTDSESAAGDEGGEGEFSFDTADGASTDASEPASGMDGEDGPSDGGQPADSEEMAGDDAATDGTASGPTRTSISALEYNKVMRLLQNREFPVERAEIETVAANAYGLSQSECAEVIDLAVDRGLIDEDGANLVRSE
jgi:hypothetical protein